MNGKCEICGNDGTIEQHHIDYKQDKTTSVCKSCHTKIHHDKLHPLYPIDDKSKSSKKSIRIDVMILPSLLDELKKIHPNRTTTFLISEASKFYIKYEGKMANYDKDTQFNNLLQEYIKLVNNKIEFRGG